MSNQIILCATSMLILGSGLFAWVMFMGHRAALASTKNRERRLGLILPPGKKLP